MGLCDLNCTKRGCPVRTYPGVEERGKSYTVSRAVTGNKVVTLTRVWTSKSPVCVWVTGRGSGVSGLRGT